MKTVTNFYKFNKKCFSPKSLNYYKTLFRNDEKKTTKLRKMIYSTDQTYHMMEAHSGLSAKIVEQTGFQAIWGSGLSISAQLGVRDSNEASWTQVVDVCDFINSAVNIPVLLDGDTGFGNFNNARRLVNRLELLGIAGVCMEDKLFPKTNSFIEKGKPQELADIDEFCLKIRACKDSQRDPDFCIVARVEALIAGHGIDEAIKRANAYYKAGADAILIHSKKAKADEIKEFLRIWNKRHPVIIVPTKYAMDTNEKEMHDLGVNMIIWANHNIRASVKAMKDVSKKIFDNKHCGPVEKEIASVNDIFDLQGEDMLAEDEKIYLKNDSLKVEKPIDSTVQHPHVNENLIMKHNTIHKGVEPVPFINHLKSLGIKFVAGVPDSLMEGFISHFPIVDDRSGDLYHTVAANEGAALALAAGYHVASQSEGPSSCIYLQNSGLGNIFNPLLSLAHKEVYSVPTLIFVGWRGDPFDYNIRDEPQHKVQGRYMLEMIRSVGYDFFILPKDSDESAKETITEAYNLSKEKQQPIFVIVKANTFNKNVNKNNYKLPDTSHLLTRRDALSIAHKLTKDFKARVGTTGKLSRELYEIAKEESGISKDFLMVGSMGHVISFTQGLCHAGVNGNVVCFDGDGSIMMHTGSLANVSTLPKKTKLLHIGFNNRIHESVGKIPTMLKNENISLSKIAESMGYTKVFKITKEEEAKKIVEEFKSVKNENGPTSYFIEWMISEKTPETKSNLSRPKETPLERKLIFQKNLH